MGAAARDAVPALLSRAALEREQARQRAIWALGQIGDERALEPLQEIFAREGGEVGCWIAEAFAAFGRRARPVAAALRDELHRDDPQLAIAAATALLAIGEHIDAAVWALIACLHHPDEDVRIEAAILLGDFGSAASAAIPALRAAEHAEEDDLRAQAKIAIAKIRPEYARAESGAT
jgi:HEAT repeat protein